MRLALAVMLCVGCGGAPPPAADRSWADEDIEAAQSPRADGPAERARPLPPDHPRDYTPRPTRRQGRRYAGRRVDFDVVDADLHNVFRLLADVGNVNIVIGDGVAGEVTLRVRSVPWDQILATIVRMKGLHMEQSGNIIMITAKPP